MSDIKQSTKDVDLLVPIETEYKYLIKTIKDLGYQQKTVSGWLRQEEDKYIFDIFLGKRIHTTELLESPLKEDKHTFLKEFSHLYIGILNDYDLIASKLFRGSSVDFEDCLMLVKARSKKIDIKYLVENFKKLASYDISENRITKNLNDFLALLREEKLYG